jgi:hypothetical protein
MISTGCPRLSGADSASPCRAAYPAGEIESSAPTRNGVFVCAMIPKSAAPPKAIATPAAASAV